MAKKKAAAKRDQPPTDAERALAEQLFVKLYISDSGRTTEYYVRVAIEAAKEFSAICPSLTKE